MNKKEKQEVMQMEHDYKMTQLAYERETMFLVEEFIWKLDKMEVPTQPVVQQPALPIPNVPQPTLQAPEYNLPGQPKQLTPAEEVAQSQAAYGGNQNGKV